MERAIAALGFRPSHIARSLVSRSTKTIGLVMGDVASPFFPDVVRGAEDVLSEAGYCLILSNSSRDPERELRNVRHLLERSTDGLILGAPQGAPDELRDLAERAAVPMVFLNRDVRGRARGLGVDRLAGRDRGGRDVSRRPRPPPHGARGPLARGDPASPTARTGIAGRSAAPASAPIPR